MPYLRASTDAPFGAMPYDAVLRTTPYRKDAAASRIFIGDFVMLEDDGNVAVATAGARLLGVAAEGSANATADTEVLVYDHPDQRFVCQDDSAGTQIAETNIGNNCDVLATTGDTTTERSQHEIDSSSAGTATAQLRLIGLHPIESGFASATGAQRKWVVVINEHEYNQATGV